MNNDVYEINVMTWKQVDVIAGTKESEAIRLRFDCGDSGILEFGLDQSNARALRSMLKGALKLKNWKN